MRILTILGARPQFIKASAFSRAVRENNNVNANSLIEEIIVHTGQHFDEKMSNIFFSELDIPQPKINLGVAGLSHAAMTGRMLESIESILLDQKPNIVLIYGDTNSTLAGALAASKLHIPIAHVEAGLRSFNMRMPEEINRILSDRISSLLFCPTTLAIENLANEGISNGVHHTGDIMLDVTNFCREKAALITNIEGWDFTCRNEYNLATIHRAENTDDVSRLISILSALNEISLTSTMILPLHPRTFQLINKLGLHELVTNIKIIEPVSYLEMMKLQMDAKTIITDSGGVQKEAFFHRIPCITLRDETEWTETVSLGWNQVVGADKDAILEAYNLAKPGEQETGNPYGDGHSAEKILNTIKENYL